MPELSCVRSIRLILNCLAVVTPSHGMLFFLHPGYILPDTVNPAFWQKTHTDITILQTSALSLAFRPPFWCPKEAFNGESLQWNHTPSRNRCDPSLWFTSDPAIAADQHTYLVPTSCTELSIPQEIREKMPPEPGKEQRCKNEADWKDVWKHQESFSSQNFGLGGSSLGNMP